MRIENYSLDLHAKHAETTNVSMSFTDELHVQNSKKSEKIESVKDELEFMKRLQYELVNELLSRLQPATCRCLPKDFSTKEFISQDMPEFATRTLSITKEYTRSESLDVSMSGCIHTATEQIKIDMNLSFSSTFTQTNTIDKTIFYDPLILSFDGELPNLDTQTFDFDIDMDGESDQISKLKKGSGFLALDKNNNGTIDDGYELFGTQ
ncbi:MAG: hypothetical protein KAR81_03745, partial [Sulfurimonas sp.]|nr:hypothetical protein [Sulfurimonas sp.]